MDTFTSVATNLIDTLGLGGVAVGLAVNCIGIPIPSEIIIPLSGIGVRHGQFDGVVVFTVAVLAQISGLLVSYAIGRFGGLELIEKYGRYIFISRPTLRRAQSSFDENGGWLVLFGLCLPGIHGYVGYPAGIAKMSLIKFVPVAVVGTSVWTGAFLALGYFLGDYLEEIEAVTRQFGIAASLVLVVGVIWYIKRRKRRTRRENSANNPA